MNSFSLNRTALCIIQLPDFSAPCNPLKYNEIEFKLLGLKYRLEEVGKQYFESSKMTLCFSFIFYWKLQSGKATEVGNTFLLEFSWCWEFSSLLWSSHQVCDFWKSVPQCDNAAAVQESWKNWLHPSLFALPLMTRQILSCANYWKLPYYFSGTARIIGFRVYN